jgi:hypothetical protein
VSTNAGDAGHEGAKESTVPGTPREREVITPDWAHLDKGSAGECVPDNDANRSSSDRDDSSDAEPAQPAKGPAIDRHR